MSGFEHITYLYLLGLVVILIMRYILVSYRRSKMAVASGSTYAPKRKRLRGVVRFLMLIFALSALIIALAGPYGAGKKQVKPGAAQAQIVFALDVSKSMLARDATPNRLIRAQGFITGLLDKLHRKEQVAVVIFAGQADTYVPLTGDYRYVKKQLQSISADLVATPGSSLTDALKISSQLLDANPTDVRALCILSDGESAEPEFGKLADNLRKSGLNIFAFGLGTPAGANIIEQRNGAERVKLDSTGEPVISRLNEQNMSRIAGGKAGFYASLADKDVAADLFIAKLEQIESSQQVIVLITEKYFQLFLLIAFVLLVIETLLN